MIHVTTQQYAVIAAIVNLRKSPCWHECYVTQSGISLEISHTYRRWGRDGAQQVAGWNVCHSFYIHPYITVSMMWKTNHSFDGAILNLMLHNVNSVPRASSDLKCCITLFMSPTGGFPNPHCFQGLNKYLKLMCLLCVNKCVGSAFFPPKSDVLVMFVCFFTHDNKAFENKLINVLRPCKHSHII